MAAIAHLPNEATEDIHREQHLLSILDLATWQPSELEDVARIESLDQVATLRDVPLGGILDQIVHASLVHHSVVAGDVDVGCIRPDHVDERGVEAQDPYVSDREGARRVAINPSEDVRTAVPGVAPEQCAAQLGPLADRGATHGLA